MRTHVVAGQVRIATSNETRPAVIRADGLDVVSSMQTPAAYPICGAAMKMQTAVRLPNATLHLGQDDIALFQSLSRDFNRPVTRSWMSAAQQGLMQRGPWAPRFSKPYSSLTSVELPNLLLATSAEPDHVVDMPGDLSHEALSLLQAPTAGIRVGFDDQLQGSPDGSVIFDFALGESSGNTDWLQALVRQNDSIGMTGGTVRPMWTGFGQGVQAEGLRGVAARQGGRGRVGMSHTGPDSSGARPCDWLLSLPSHHPTSILADARRAELAVDPSGLGSLVLRLGCFDALLLHGRYQYGSRTQLHTEDIMKLGLRLK